LACAILRDVPKHGAHVFVGDNGKPICGFSSARARLAGIIAESGNTIEHWTIHDLRRTCATGLGRLEVPEFIIGKVLNHASKGVTGQVYNHAEYLKEKREALDRWAQYLGNLTAPPGANVVALRQVVAS
jgi:integrase